MVARGHDSEEVIRNYSIRKINRMYEIAMDNLDKENKLLGIAFRYAQNAGAKEFDRWLKGK